MKNTISNVSGAYAFTQENVPEQVLRANLKTLNRIHFKRIRAIIKRRQKPHSDTENIRATIQARLEEASSADPDIRETFERFIEDHSQSNINTLANDLEILLKKLQVEDTDEVSDETLDNLPVRFKPNFADNAFFKEFLKTHKLLIMPDVARLMAAEVINDMQPEERVGVLLLYVEQIYNICTDTEKREFDEVCVQGISAEALIWSKLQEVWDKYGVPTDEVVPGFEIRRYDEELVEG